MLLSDHGQTAVERAAALEEPFADLARQVVVTASNRAARSISGRRRAWTPPSWPGGWTASLPSSSRSAARGTRYRAPGRADAPVDKLDHPDAARRSRAALANPNAGELLVSAAEGWELADLGGGHHVGGGSHGSLVAGDSLVPIVTVGLRAPGPRRITEVAPAVLEHFGVAVPESMEALAGVG